MFPETLEENDNLKNTINNYFTEFSSYLAVGPSSSLPTIVPVIDFLPVIDILTIEQASEIVSKYFSADSDNLLLVGIYKKLIQSSEEVKIAHSFINNTAYVFVNYEPKSLLSTNEKIISFIMLNEFVNYLFFRGEKELEIHTGDCFRNLSKLLERNPTQDFNNGSGDITQLHFCSVCSEKIQLSLVKLASESNITDENLPDQTVSMKNVEPDKIVSQPSNLVRKATSPPPRNTQLLADPNAYLTFDQRKLINKFLKDAGIRKEPIEDSEYLEIRQRFFDGKISDQVFMQMLKRKAKY